MRFCYSVAAVLLITSVYTTVVRTKDCVLFIITIIDRFCIALFSALEQTHCARMRFYMSE